MTLHEKAKLFRWWIALAMGAIIVGALAAPVATIVVTRQHSAIAAADEVVARISERTSDLLEHELTDAERTIEVISLLLESAIAEDSVAQLLESHMRTVPQLSGAYVGLPDGSFTFVRRDADHLTLKQIAVAPDRVVTETPLDGPVPSILELHDDTYDPRTRPWYASAAAARGLIWTDPYVFFSSGRPGVTAALAVHDAAGSTVAVVGVDIDLAQLTSILDGLPIGSEAEAFILAGDVVVAAPSGWNVARKIDGGVSLASPSEIGLDPDDLWRARTEARPIRSSNESRLQVVAFDDPLLPDWEVAIKTGHLDFVDVVKNQSRIALVATIVAGLALLALVPVLVARLRKPIDELNQRARIDHLTGLSNRATLLEEGGRELKRARQWGQDLVVAVLDIDNFKSINDRYGHTVGDETIREISAGIRAAVRPQDLVGRLGGDEFVVVFRDLSERESAAMLERLQAKLKTTWNRDRRTRGLGVTIGVARLGGRPGGLVDLINEADHRLISAKRCNKGAIVTA